MPIVFQEHEKVHSPDALPQLVLACRLCSLPWERLSSSFVLPAHCTKKWGCRGLPVSLPLIAAGLRFKLTSFDLNAMLSTYPTKTSDYPTGESRWCIVVGGLNGCNSCFFKKYLLWWACAVVSRDYWSWGFPSFTEVWTLISVFPNISGLEMKLGIMQGQVLWLWARVSLSLNNLQRNRMLNQNQKEAEQVLLISELWAPLTFSGRLHPLGTELLKVVLSALRLSRNLWASTGQGWHSNMGQCWGPGISEAQASSTCLPGINTWVAGSWRGPRTPEARPKGWEILGGPPSSSKIFW